MWQTFISMRCLLRRFVCAASQTQNSNLAVKEWERKDKLNPSSNYCDKQLAHYISMQQCNLRISCQQWLQTIEGEQIPDLKLLRKNIGRRKCEQKGDQKVVSGALKLVHPATHFQCIWMFQVYSTLDIAADQYP